MWQPNLKKKTELKSADSKYHMMVFRELFDQGGTKKKQLKNV